MASKTPPTRCKTTGVYLKTSDYGLAPKDHDRVGVYAITNRVNGKRYIGNTTDGFYSRWSKHVLALQAGNHINPHMQNSYNKHGLRNFDFSIVEDLTGASKDFIVEREQHYIDQGTDYNINQIATGGNPSMTTPKEKVDQIISDFLSTPNATVLGFSNKYKISRVTIRRILTGKHVNSQHMSQSVKDIISKRCRANVRTAASKTNNGNKRPITCLDTGKVYTCASQAAKKLGVSASMIRDVIRGRYPTDKFRLNYSDSIGGLL